MYQCPHKHTNEHTYAHTHTPEQTKTAELSSDPLHYLDPQTRWRGTSAKLTENVILSTRDWQGETRLTHIGEDEKVVVEEEEGSGSNQGSWISIRRNIIN